VPRLDEAATGTRSSPPATGSASRFARAELEAPDIILLDEATSALETDMALELLAELRAARPDAIILAFGQSTGFAEAATHRVLMKRAGGVVRLGHAEGARRARRRAEPRSRAAMTIRQPLFLTAALTTKRPFRSRRP
jgi:putative ATP-binding cassette transporter